MSQTHIAGLDGMPRCGREHTRGYLTVQQYNALVSDKKLAKRIKTRVKHSCRLVRLCDCPRTKVTVSSICRDCQR